MSSPEATFLTPLEACEALGIGQLTYVYRVLATGVLRGERDKRGRWRIPAEAVDEYLARREARRARSSASPPVTPIDDLLARSRGEARS